MSRLLVLPTDNGSDNIHLGVRLCWLGGKLREMTRAQCLPQNFHFVKSSVHKRNTWSSYLLSSIPQVLALFIPDRF